MADMAAQPSVRSVRFALLMALRITPILAAAALVACGSAATPDVAGACNRVASPSGSDGAAGTQDAPFRTVQRLADSLDAGETGCLRAGTYDKRQDGGYVLRFRDGGRAGAPVTVKSYPGERAKLEGTVYVPKKAPHVTVRDLDIDGRARWIEGEPVTVKITAAGVTFQGNRLTNRRLKSCLILGSNSGFGAAVRPVVRDNVFRDCGDPAHDLQDHAIYAENVSDGLITGNVFSGTAGFAIHLYPNARRNRVTRNVMVDNGGGVIVAGDEDHSSSDNVIERNVIAGSRKAENITLYWEGRAGTGNVARGNCLVPGRGGNADGGRGLALAGNVVARPEFVDPESGDYRLEPGSPCGDLVGAGLVAAAARVARR